MKLFRENCGAGRGLFEVTFLVTMTTAILLSAFSLPAEAGVEKNVKTDNPYQNINWSDVRYLHSASHLHGARNEPVLKAAYDMGLRHLAFSDYYPSEPLFPLPESFREKYADALSCPNSEHHNCTDNPLHFCTLGSFYTTGSGNTPRLDLTRSPLEHTFSGLTVFDGKKEPWKGVYFLDLLIGPKPGAKTAPEVKVTLNGAVECDQKGNGSRDELTFQNQVGFVFIKALKPDASVIVAFDPKTTEIKQLRLMQGTNRPWKDAFRAALDGKAIDSNGRRIEGLLYPDGGGITLNHPRDASFQTYLAMLDFDPRVLGIEVWNQHFGFGMQKGVPGQLFYESWDAILKTGRRCFGFFVKDHRYRGRGRNILLVPNAADLTREEQEHNALRAYRNGAFFGLLGAMHVNEEGKVVSPYDQSDFRFTKIQLDEKSSVLEVSVAGNDPIKRPNLEFRLITEKGIVEVVDQASATRFTLPTKPDGSIACKFARVEAYAYPSSHLNGQPLTPDEFRKMDVTSIARLHDSMGDLSYTEADLKGQAPIPIVDMIFSQAIRFGDGERQ